MRILHFEDSDPISSINSISFVNPAQGYVAFDNSIGYTSDSGRSYTRKYITHSNVDYNGYFVNLLFSFAIEGVKAVSTSTIIVYGDYGGVPSILYSTNGGDNYKLIYHSHLQLNLANSIRHMIFPLNNLVGYAVDYDRIIKTVNGGLSWFVVYESEASNFKRLYANNNDTVFAVQTINFTGRMIWTSNAGLNWQNLPLPSGPLNGVAVYNSSNLWASVGYSLYFSANYGQQWTAINEPMQDGIYLNDMQFVNDSTGFGLSGGDAYKSTDGGRIWERLPTDYNIDSFGAQLIHFIHPNQFWIAGLLDFMAINTNPGLDPLPSAYFTVDTTGLLATGLVHLKNHSNTRYNYRWYKNDTLISTSYNASYNHNVFQLRDTIKLEVLNATGSAVQVRHVDFHRPVIINSFNPQSAGQGTEVIISGEEFNGAYSVSFGGKEAAWFTVVDNNTIRAVLDSGLSGIVRVATLRNIGTKAGFTFIPRPIVLNFSPTAATAGSSVIVNGQYLENAGPVKIGGVAANFNYISPTQISVTVPSGPSGPIEVVTPGGSHALGGFINLPTLSSFSPQSGTFGTYITVNGTSLTDINSVKIGGLQADSFIIVSSTQIIAIPGEGNSGSITVSKPGGSASQGLFEWYAPPVISSISPLSGTAGTLVTVTGTGFNPIPSNNIVYFGSVKAVVTSGSTTSLTVIVPNSAPFSPVSVTNRGLTAYSSKPFLLTFTNGSKIDKESFSNKLVIPADSAHFPLFFTVGDFDNDGKLDVVFANMDENNREPYQLTVLRNTSIGSAISFSRSDLVISESPKNISTADLDGDGKLDLAIGSAVDGSIRIYRNTSLAGNISFANPVTITGVEPGDNIILSDIDKDGKTDMLNGKTIFRNISEIGALAFTSRQLLIEGSSLMLRDMDGDGWDDILSGDLLTNNILVFRNISVKGRIGFSPAYPTACEGPWTLFTGDVDGDGKPDLLTQTHATNSVRAFRNTSNQGTISFEGFTDYALGMPNSNMSLHDLNGDGRLDVITAHKNANLSLLENLSSTGTIVLENQVSYDTVFFFGYNEIATADFNGDNKPDIINGSFTTKAITIYINNVVPKPAILGFSPTIAKSGDTITITGRNFNNVSAVSFGTTPAQSYTVISSTIIKAVVANGESGMVSVTNNYGTGTLDGFNYGFGPVITQINPASAPTGLDVIISGNYFGATPSENVVYFGSVRANIKSANTQTITATVPKGFSTDHPVSITTNKFTGFSSKIFYPSFPGATENLTPNSFKNLDFYRYGESDAFDFDNDGKPDIFRSGSGVFIARNTSQPGNLSFENDISLTAGGPNNVVKSIAVDVDGDGIRDLVSVVNGFTPMISVFKNISTPGNLVFGPRIDIIVSTYVREFRDIDAADIDRDGKPDIIITDYNSSVLILRNESKNNQIVLTPKPLLHIDHYIKSISVADMDGDDYPDIVGSLRDVMLVGIWKNNSVPGFISFSPAQKFDIGVETEHLDVADLNKDGRLDIIGAGGHFHEIALRRNLSSPGTIAFGNIQRYETGFEPWYINTSDVDGDEKIDVIVQNRYSKSVSILKNSSSGDSISLQSAVNYVLREEGKSAVVADFDIDGKPDILANTLYSSPSILLNNTGAFIISESCTNGNTIISSDFTGAVYQWQQNTGSGFVSITNNSNFSGTNTANLQINNIPAGWNGYQYRCLVNGNKYSSVYLLSIVGTAVTPTVTISTSSTTICTGTSISFTAIAEHGGSSPSYQWTVNNVNTGANQATFTSSTLKNNDVVKVVLTSNAVCLTRTTDTSNEIVMTVRPKETPSITISGNSVVNHGQATLLTTSIQHGGNSPRYQWQDSTESHSWSTISNAVGQTISYTPVKTGDKIRCNLISNDSCAIRPDAVSNALIFTVNIPTSVGPIPAIQFGIRFFPNPATDIVILDSIKRSDGWQTLSLLNAGGFKLFDIPDIRNETQIRINVQALRAGVYMIVLRRRSGEPAYIRFVKL